MNGNKKVNSDNFADITQEIRKSGVNIKQWAAARGFPVCTVRFALAGYPRTFKAREVLDIIRGEGERVEEPEFIRIFTELTQAGLVEVAEVPEVDAAQLFRITRRGVEVLKLKEGDSFDERSVEIDILQSRPEGLNIYEVKSGQALSKDHLRHINSFKKKFDTNKSGVIYSGEDYPSFEGNRFLNFHNAYSLFTPEEEPFRLSF